MRKIPRPTRLASATPRTIPIVATESICMSATALIDRMVRSRKDEQQHALLWGGLILRVLLVHSRYLRRGGEDAVCAAEGALRRRFGHDVTEFVRDNQEIAGNALQLFASTIWSRSAYAQISECIRKTQP